MKIVLELGELENKGLIEIKHVGYMRCDPDEEPASVTIGYLIEIKKENLQKVPKDLKYNWEGDTKDGELFGVFI